ncbi:MAG: chromate transporter [Lactobacillaceae bacterium]|jgi:chromate transporter|nr:chromate transporter [Lactobacillaceae bacterium]
MTLYFLLFFEFAKIGLFSIGGGMAAIPFLFELVDKYGWFTSPELIDMIAISTSTPGPIGVNMATFAGYRAAGIWGGVFATLSTAVPSVIIVMLVSKVLHSPEKRELFYNLLYGVRAAVIALIFYTGAELASLSIIDIKTLILALVLAFAVFKYKRHPILYIVAAAIIGVVFKL